MLNGEELSEVERIVIANSLIMFLAGFTTVSFTTSTMLYFLAKNQDCQERLYQEIKIAVDKAGTEKLDYSALTGLEYMEMCFQEALCMSFGAHIERYAVRDYKIPGTNVVVPKNTCVRFPSGAIAKDAQYFADPCVFDPERFNARNKAGRNPMTASSFGHGPRNCIAKRCATMEVKMVIARVS